MSSDTRRHDGDAWGLASGVGATATAVATARALATRTGLIDDRWAEPLVRAVDMPHFLKILDGEPDAAPEAARMANGMAVRTRYFDRFLADAGAAGIRQAVILASGLDARGYRFDWPAGSRVFEIDQPAVIDFKVATLARLGASPTAEVHNIGVDLRDDWPAALKANGFDTGRPTAWIAEGLLMYLPPAAQDTLFDQITALSRQGSRLATEFFPDMAAFTEGDGTTGDARWKRFGFPDDLTGLVYPGPRSHVGQYLQALSWRVSASLVRELSEAYDIEHREDEMAAKFEDFQYVSAQLA